MTKDKGHERGRQGNADMADNAVNTAINDASISQETRSTSDPQAQRQRAASPTSPLSPRTRDRGYSLRRSLFARRISNQPEPSPIELAETGRQHGRAQEPQSADKAMGDQDAKFAMANNVEDPSRFSQTQGGRRMDVQQGSQGTEKKHFGSSSLPSYASQLKTGASGDSYWIKAKRTYKKTFINSIFGQKQIPKSIDGRHIPIEIFRDKPLVDERTGKEYMGNSIRSSRYTLWNFLPRQLFYQFSKLANAYFLLVSILQMIPGLSTTGTYTTVAPLLLFVSISMAKEGYDDVRRYKLDKIENNKETMVLRPSTQDLEIEVSHTGGPGDAPQTTLPPNGALPRSESLDSESAVGSCKLGQNVSDGEDETKHWIIVKWRDLKVGDVIKLKRDDDVPADMVIMYADGPNGVAYIETMALDGETNLKSKQAPPHLTKQCRTLHGIVNCKAHIVAEDPNVDLYSFDGKATLNNETLPLTTNEIIFRGSTLRNTQTAIGMIINTGEECKIRMNANKNPRIKAPAIQATTNKIIIMLVVFVMLLSLLCTIAYQIWTKDVEVRSWYLAGGHVKIAQIFIGFVILYNTLIPLSLYVSLEIIKIGQLLLMRDAEMYDPVSNTPMVCNTGTILENLGQIGYIFSDKTGTLTDNIMNLRKLSVAGYAWVHDFDLRKAAAEMEQESLDAGEKGKGKGVTHPSSRKETRPASPNRKRSGLATSSLEGGEALRRSGSVSLWKSSARPRQQQQELRTDDLILYMQHKPHSVFTKKAKFFLLNLALCHTCLPEIKDDGKVEFQASSPDELALVRAAQELGYLVANRATQKITLKIPGAGGVNDGETVTEEYEILDVIEFSSKRKRMSIIVRFPNGKICIFCKGADSAILPRLKLASLAAQKAAEVSKRSSRRKSLEAEEALRRMSEHSTSESFRGSVSSFSRKSMGLRRSSTASTRKLHPIRDELGGWHDQREHDDELAPEGDVTYQSPRASLTRPSFASSGRQASYQSEYFDDLIDEAIVLDDAAIFERCFVHLEDFSTEGLRTLLFAYRFLDDHEYEGWKKIYLDATTSLVDRQELIERAGETIEQNFDLAGSTAIEDKLQKGVPETIDKLRRANIKIWMLTGDKRETAINIAHSARICKSYSQVVVLDHTIGELEQRMASTLSDITNGTITHSVIAIDGQTLSVIDANEVLARLFFDLVVLADSVICCRASPSQKASLVKKIRTKVNGSITLAIGDGANDIAMIQEAHVGIGISGKEGLQAARISDYSIAQFRFLQKLLLVHGRWNYVRTAKYILLTFWKETLFYLIQALYQRWAGYTGTSLFESTSLTVFNALFTSLAVIIIGIFEQDLNASTLLAVPELYAQGQRHEAFNIKKYFAWMFIAVLESLVVFFVAYGLYGESRFVRDNNVLATGQLCFTASVIIINLKGIILEMHNKTIIPILAFLITVGGWFLWNILLSGVFKPNKTYLLYPIYRSFLDYYGRNIVWWLLVLLTVASVVVLELGVSSLRKTFWPCDTDIFQVLQKDKVIRERFEETLRREAAGEGGGDFQMAGDEKRSAEAIREVEIQELLQRPRVLPDDGPDNDVEGRQRVGIRSAPRTVSFDATAAIDAREKPPHVRENHIN